MHVDDVSEDVLEVSGVGMPEAPQMGTAHSALSQLTGIDTVNYFGPTILKSTGLSTNAA